MSRSFASAPPLVSFPITVIPAVTATSLGVPGANEAHYLRVLGAGTISKIGLHVTVSSGNISVAVFRGSGEGRNCAPTTRAATSGSVACPAVGYAEVSLGGSVTVGINDFLCLTVDNTTATFRCADGGFVTPSDTGKGLRYNQATGHPAPATATPTACLGRVFVMVGVA